MTTSMTSLIVSYNSGLNSSESIRGEDGGGAAGGAQPGGDGKAPLPASPLPLPASPTASPLPLLASPVSFRVSDARRSESSAT